MSEITALIPITDGADIDVTPRTSEMPPLLLGWAVVGGEVEPLILDRSVRRSHRAMPWSDYKDGHPNANYTITYNLH